MCPLDSSDGDCCRWNRHRRPWPAGSVSRALSSGDAGGGTPAYFDLMDRVADELDQWVSVSEGGVKGRVTEVTSSVECVNIIDLKFQPSICLL